MKWGITRWSDPERGLSTVFDDFFRVSPVEIFGNDLNPKVDIQEDEHAVYVKAEVPGLEEKNINVELKDNVLTISGEKKEEKSEEDKSRNYRYSERRFGSFCRTVVLPEGIKADAVTAHYKNGVLEIELPKSEAAKPKKIEVSVN